MHTPWHLHSPGSEFHVHDFSQNTINSHNSPETGLIILVPDTEKLSVSTLHETVPVCEKAGIQNCW